MVADIQLNSILLCVGRYMRRTQYASLHASTMCNEHNAHVCFTLLNGRNLGHHLIENSRSLFVDILPTQVDASIHASSLQFGVLNWGTISMRCADKKDIKINCVQATNRTDNNLCDEISVIC